MIHRRSLIKGLGLLFAAPAIVKAENLMKIAAPRIIKVPRVIIGRFAPGQYGMIITASDIIDGTLWTTGTIMSKDGNFVMDFTQNMATIR